jgi:hypothetical protein
VNTMMIQENERDLSQLLNANEAVTFESPLLEKIKREASKWDADERQTLSRMFLRTYREFAGGPRETFMRELLTQWVWRPSWLNAEFSQHVAPFGEFTPTLTSQRAFEDYLKRITGDPKVWYARVHFPTWTPARRLGQLVRAEIRSFPKWADQADLAVVPWSHYLPKTNEDSEEGPFEELVKNLAPALRATFGDNADKLKDMAFAVELSPLQKDELFLGPVEDPDVRVYDLTPPGFRVDGASLGLAIAVAAWATIQRLSPVNVIATGCINDGGSVQPVGKTVEKARAVLKYFELAPIRGQFLMPEKNYGSLDRDLYAELNVRADLIQTSSLSDLFGVTKLADGFDPYRIYLGLNPGSSGPDPLPPLPAASDGLDDLQRSGQDAGQTEQGYSCADIDEITSLARALEFKLNGEPLSQPEFLTVPFDETPEFAAAELIRQLRQGWWGQAKLHEHAVLPVFLPVKIGALAASGGAVEQSTLAERLAHAVPDWISAMAQITPGILGNALATSDKLVLVAFDAPSLRLWKRISGQLESYQETLKGLASLARTRKGHSPSWSARCLIAVCSDYHHEQLWRKALTQAD